jgi:hypothetical protein
VFVWGDDSKGQLGIEKQYSKEKERREQIVDRPRACSFGVVITAVSVGD